MTRAEQLRRIVPEISVNCRVQCHFCGGEMTWPNDVLHAYNDERGTAQFQAAAFFYAEGWRNITSRKYQVTGAMRCPECKGET